MNRKEKRLFKSLCSFKSATFDESILDAATPEVLGNLFFNRMQGIAYGNLANRNLLSKLSREFRNSLKDTYELNIEKNKSFFSCIKYLSEILSSCNCQYAMLKGAYLCKLYPEGYRTSNDIDILVSPANVSIIGRKLVEHGFMQGHIRNGKFCPATRHEIIASKMMRGETVPYIKQVDFSGMKFLEVDINFSLDYKSGNIYLLEEMLCNSVNEITSDYNIKTLREDDFFVHLCNHLYKEATTLPWIEMQRDMTLYKYGDVYMLLNDIPKEKTDFLFERAKELKMEKICAFAVIQTSQLFCFENDYAVQIAKDVLAEDNNYINMVIDPKNRKTYLFTETNIEKRFFDNCRKKYLKELELQ